MPLLIKNQYWGEKAMTLSLVVCYALPQYEIHSNDYFSKHSEHSSHFCSAISFHGNFHTQSRFSARMCRKCTCALVHMCRACVVSSVVLIIRYSSVSDWKMFTPSSTSVRYLSKIEDPCVYWKRLIRFLYSWICSTLG